MSYQDYQNGRNGGPASNTTEYYSGRDQLMREQAAEIDRYFRDNASVSAPQPIQQTDAGYYSDATPHTASTGSVSHVARMPRRRTEWDENPAGCIRDLALPLAVSAFIIMPILAVTGAFKYTVWLGHFLYDGRFPELLGYGVPALLLAYGSFVVASFKIYERDQRRLAAAGIAPFHYFANQKAKKLKS